MQDQKTNMQTLQVGKFITQLKIKDKKIKNKIKSLFWACLLH